jgi:hypothetical protein
VYKYVINVNIVNIIYVILQTFYLGCEI